jgi:hypothetical protein
MGDMKSPLIPTFSPQGGEGVSLDAMTENKTAKIHDASIISPSPPWGERVGVRGDSIPQHTHMYKLVWNI